MKLLSRLFWQKHDFSIYLSVELHSLHYGFGNSDWGLTSWLFIVLSCCFRCLKFKLQTMLGCVCMSTILLMVFFYGHLLHYFEAFIHVLEKHYYWYYQIVFINQVIGNLDMRKMLGKYGKRYKLGCYIVHVIVDLSILNVWAFFNPNHINAKLQFYNLLFDVIYRYRQFCL